ncbi:DNA-3-methyladenine glycosylase 2 family protein [Rhodophyticola sp. CCM32]|nr:DNA-3-methyladenine glycosylase 2 family protein [Rhodophyticola sp. CCM32]
MRDERDLERGAVELVGLEPRFGPVLEVVGCLPLRLREDGFAALLSAIVSQQVSTASAAAIWARMEAAGLVGAAAVCKADDRALKAVGLSRPKMRYARALAKADLDYAGLREAEPEDVVQTLMKLPGVGRWTAEIYAKFSLGHADVFAAGDLALQESARLVFELEARPGEAELRRMADAWAPWRAVAARALWAYYRVAKNREGIR